MKVLVNFIFLLSAVISTEAGAGTQMCFLTENQWSSLGNSPDKICNEVCKGGITSDCPAPQGAQGKWIVDQWHKIGNVYRCDCEFP